LIRDMEKRTGAFRRNRDLEALLAELAEYLSSAERAATTSISTPKYPPLLLIGAPRSGTTLFMQFLAMTGAFAVPTNLLARFNYAPYLGTRIQQLLCDKRFDLKNELADLSGSVSLTSRLGTTSGALNPNEFYHFWRRFFPNYDIEYLDEEQLQKVDIEGLRKGLASIEAGFDLPVATKGLMLLYNVDLAHRIFPNALIVYLQRESFFVMQSILLSREEFYNDRNRWWSAKPRTFADLQKLDPFHQIAGQVYFTEEAIDSALDALPDKNVLKLNYESFCKNPVDTLHQVSAKYQALGKPLASDYQGPKQLTISDTVRLTTQDAQSLREAYSDFVQGRVSLAPDA